MTPLPGGQVPPTEAVTYNGTNVATAKPFDEVMVAPVSENSKVPSW